MAVVSAGPYASLHLAPDRQPRQHPTTQFFTGRMPFLPPNQQRQSTEGHLVIGALQITDVIRYMTVSWVSTPQYSHKRQASNLHFPHCTRPHLLLLAQDTGYTKQTHGHDYETDRQIQRQHTSDYTHTHTHTPI